MKFKAGETPQWAGKPKTSPLDSDAEFMKLRAKILSGTMKPMEQAGLFVDPSDGKRLKTKHPARLVRDHLRRTLKETNLEADFVLTCRQTAEPGVWGVWVTYEPRDAMASKKDRRHHAQLIARSEPARAR